MKNWNICNKLINKTEHVHSSFLSNSCEIWGGKQSIISHFYTSQCPTDTMFPMEQVSPSKLTDTGIQWPRAAVRTLPKKKWNCNESLWWIAWGNSSSCEEPFKNVFPFCQWNIVPSESTDEWVVLDPSPQQDESAYSQGYSVRFREPIHEPGHFCSISVQARMQNSSFWLAWL